MRFIDRLLPKVENLSLYIDARRELPRTAIAFIWYFIRLLGVPLGATVLCYGIATAFMTLESYFLGRIVSALSSGTHDTMWQRVIEVVGLYLLVCQVSARALYTLSDIVNSRVFPVLIMLVRERLAKYLYKHSYGYFQEDFAGRLAGKVMEMPQAVHDTIYEMLDTLLYLAVINSTAIALFIGVKWQFGCLAALFFIASALLCSWRQPQFSVQAKRSAAALQMTRGHYLDGISNILLVKLFSKEMHEQTLLAKSLKITASRQQELAWEKTVWTSAQRILNALFQGAILMLGLYLYYRGGLSLGDLTMVLTLGVTVSINIWWLMHTFSTFFSNFATIDDGLKTILQSHEITDAPDAVPLPSGRGDIALDRVTFAYPNRPVFDAFSLDIPAGQKVGLVGPSGAGKSTLMQLLLRLSDIQAGAIRIGGQDIRAVPQADLRRAITVIPQATELMHRSIRDNILYGDPEAGDERMIEAARRAHIDETIHALSDQHGHSGYDALVGERGVKLSGGQRQRIAIARAFLKDSPILILDEATSALDSESERLIQDSFAELFRGRTVIAIAHRLSTIAHLDRIVVLDQGKIVEDGAHADLLAAGGLYARLWALQSGGFIGPG